MKYLPELPTKELLDAIAYGQPIASSHEDIYTRIRAAAPEMKDEPVAFARTFDGEMITDSLTMFLDTAERELSRMNAEFPDVDRREIVPLYRCPPEVEALKAEIERLHNLIETHNKECVSQCEFCQKQGRCDGFVIRGLQCTDCPRYYTISAEQ